MSHTLGINPWYQIWSTPRKTIRQIVDYQPRRGLFWLGSIVVLHHFFVLSVVYGVKFSSLYMLMLMITLALSPLVGMLWLIFNGWALYVTGKLFKGRGSMWQLTAAFGWSRIPFLINIFLWFMLLVFGSPYLFALYRIGFSLLFIFLINSISGIWAFGLLLGNVAEVQDLTLWKAFGNIFISSLFVVAVSWLFIYLFHFFSGSLAFIL